MRLMLCGIIVAVAFPRTVLARWETLLSDYMPALNGRPWPRFPVTAYVETKSNIWVHPSARQKYPTFQEIGDKDADFTTVVMRMPDGFLLKTNNDAALGPYLAAVYSGDFNHDGLPDFIAIKPGGGCGLGAENCIGIFAFSEKTNQYVFTRVWSMGLGPQNLVLDPKTKAFRFIHTSFRQADTLDGRYHSFFVHRFYKWDSGTFEPDSDRAPLWVQFLFRANHEPTTLLNANLKAKAGQQGSDSEARIEW